MNYDPRFAAVCGDARLPSQGMGRLVKKEPAVSTQDFSQQWDAGTLRALLASRLAGDQVIVVSNRQPFSHEVVMGDVKLTQPASGLVTALEPVVRACNGTWIAHGSGEADRHFVDASDRWSAPADSGSYRLRRIWLTAQEQQGYCDGFSNSGLWPLCHMVHVRPTFEEADWQHYRAVNARFANAVVREARGQDPVVLIQDYHLALVPAMVRAQLPLATIITFWHIPWPHPQQMGMCPWLDEIMHGLLGSDIVGLQTRQDARNFADLAGHVGARVIQGDSTEILHGNRITQVRDYPISIAWPTPAATTALPSVKSSRRIAEKQWSLPAEGRFIIGIDRFDYTKGIIERLHAFEELMTSRPQWQGLVRFVQVAAPSRARLKEYKDFQGQVHAEVDRINAKFHTLVHRPIVLLDSHHDRAALDRLYRAADVCLVTSLHDGMNLVCKEFVAARDDEQGVLVLSQFAGAADELSDALIVNPYHCAQVAESIHQALSMSKGEQRQRMQALRQKVKSANVYRWAGRMLTDAAALRSTAVPQIADSLPQSTRASPNPQFDDMRQSA
jgi:alpha,alpha-trehalose-phosphate synthase [UDP-forming]